MVSVMAVKIQFSSPRGVLRSMSLPGRLSSRSGERSFIVSGCCRMNHRIAMLTGVVRHEVNMSAG